MYQVRSYNICAKGAQSDAENRTRATAVAPLVEKGLTSTKPVAKQKAMDALLLYVEMDKADPVIEELLPLLAHKLPKIVAATLSAFTAICHAFGTKVVDPKPILKTLPKAYGHADKNVRAEAQNLTVELYRWLTDSMKPLFWNDLKPVQQQDLEKLFEKVKDEPGPKAERLLKSQQAIVAKAGNAEEEEDADVGEDAEEEVDLEPELLAVDVMAKLPKDLFDRLASTKWKDRKEALDDLQTAVNAPAIEDSNFMEIMSALAKCMKDANIMVVTVAGNCVELLAKGLKRNFGKYRPVVMGAILDRLKERKQTVTDALGAALDAICATSTMSDYLETLIEYLGNKNPQVKLETTKVLVRALKTTKEAPSIPEVKTIADASIKLLSDSAGPQRDAGAEVLGTLLKMMGERIMNTHFEHLTDIQKTKIKEFCETVETRAKYKPKAAAPPPKPAAAPAATKKPTLGTKKSAPVVRKAPTPAPVEEAPAPLQPKPTARTGMPKPPPAGRLGLKAPGAGLAGKKPIGSSSPQKQPTTASAYDDEAAPPPKIARALTGRTLAKPPSAMPEQPPAAPANPLTLTSAELEELEELRGETERLKIANERLRAEQSKLSSQVHELQDQNAQLIEDHTRDVLSIKAKETQLVRARSDAETAEQTASQLQREVDRLKREINQMNRSNTNTNSYNDNSNYNNDVFQDSTINANNNRTVDYNDSTSTSIQPIRKMISPIDPHAREGKENNMDVEVDTMASKFGRMLSPSAGLDGPTALARPSRTNTSPVRPISAASSRSAAHETGSTLSNEGLPLRMRPNTMYGAPRGQSPAGGGDPHSDEFVGVSRNAASAVNGGPGRTTTGISRPASMISSRSGGTAGGGAVAGQESWRRAAEVTQNLKARIELMKVSHSTP